MSVQYFVESVSQVSECKFRHYCERVRGRLESESDGGSVRENVGTRICSNICQFNVRDYDSVPRF